LPAEWHESSGSTGFVAVISACERMSHLGRSCPDGLEVQLPLYR